MSTVYTSKIIYFKNYCPEATEIYAVARFTIKLLWPPKARPLYLTAVIYFFSSA